MSMQSVCKKVIEVIVVRELLSNISTLGKAWQSVKAELRHRSEAHSKFVEEVSTMRNFVAKKQCHS